MVPTYTTTDPSGLFLTTSGLALDASTPTTIEPVLYDPTTMSTPWLTPGGVQVAMLPDGTVQPVAVGSEFIDASASLPPGVANILGSGVQAAGNWLQHLLSPAGVTPVHAAPVSALGNPMTLLLIGAAAYFLLRKK